MSLGKPEAALKRDLEGIASDLKWSAVELKRIAHRLETPDREALLRMVETFTQCEARLSYHAEEVRAGRIVSSSGEPAQGTSVSLED
ncbi:hypothetical protein [Pseudomonas massiliensis]|uniref:hypothetical protein n=1 Tax=Pseudomonas massiliensis TaxID=522492 RepID=UPI000693EE84|nr:hypothetical protein [Pseudomonas massiliensis]